MLIHPSDRESPEVALWAAALWIVLLVAYPLSYGPVLRLLYAVRWDESVGARGVNYLYAPIEVVCDRSEVCGSVRSQYLDWCGVYDCVAKRVLEEAEAEPISFTDFRRARTRAVNSDGNNLPQSGDVD